MRHYFFLLLCLLVFHVQALPANPTEPVGQRFGMSLLEVLDSLHEEGVYQYAGSSGKPKPDGSFQVRFRDSSGNRMLAYAFTADKCDLAMLMLPLHELDATVQQYDRQFPSIGKQMWRTPYGRIKISVAISGESLRSDHKPHLLILFDPQG